jgi:hypothetical protein
MSKARSGELIIPREHFRILVNQNKRSQFLDIAILAELQYHKKHSTSLKDMNSMINFFCELYGISIVCARRSLKRLHKQGFFENIGGKHEINL